MRHYSSRMSSKSHGKDVEQRPSVYITGDFYVELGLLCTDEDDFNELNEMCGPLCWQGVKTIMAGSRS